MTERIDDLVLEHAAPAGRAHQTPVLFIHGMWAGSRYQRSCLYAGLGSVSLLDYVEDVRRCLARPGRAVLVILGLQWVMLSHVTRYLPAMVGRAFSVDRAHADHLFLNRLSPQQRLPGGLRARPHADDRGRLGAALQGRPGMAGAGAR